MSEIADIKEQIRAFILSEFLPGESAANLTDDTALRTSGVLDSIATVTLISFVEDTYHIELEAHETGIQNFDRIEDIAALVASKKSVG